MTVSTSVCGLLSVLVLRDAVASDDTLLRSGGGGRFFPFGPSEQLDSYLRFLSSFRLTVSVLMESDGAEPGLLVVSVSTRTEFAVS
jgi:hypothetical protein